MMFADLMALQRRKSRVTSSMCNMVNERCEILSEGLMVNESLDCRVLTRCVLCFGVIGMQECQLVRPLLNVESLQYSADPSLPK